MKEETLMFVRNTRLDCSEHGLEIFSIFLPLGTVQYSIENLKQVAKSFTVRCFYQLVNLFVATHDSFFFAPPRSES